MADDLADLDDDALEHLWSSGAPHDRARAALGLAVRWGRSFGADAALPAEPHPGVRRHLLTIVAGRGRLDLLRFFSEHDTSPEVRAAALRLRFLCTSSPERADEAVRIAELALRDVGVRATALDVLGDAYPEALRSHLLPMLEDRDYDVRTLALRRLLTGPIDAHRGAAIGVLLDRHLDATELADFVQTLSAQADERELGGCLARFPSRYLDALLGALSTVRWSVAASAFSVGDPERERRIVDRIEDPESIPTVWLVARVLGLGRPTDDWPSWYVGHRCAEWLRGRALGLTAIPAEARDGVHALAETLAARSARELAQLADEESSLDDDLHDASTAAATAPDDFEDDGADGDDDDDDWSDEFGLHDDRLGAALADREFVENLRAWLARG